MSGNSTDFSGKHVVVAVGGGIAAYKTAFVVSRLVQAGCEVDVVLTHGATHFVGAATFSGLCGRPPVIDVYDARFPLGAHIELARKTDCLVVAPATARLLASFALGLADDLASTLYLACTCPVLLAPAMNGEMWDKQAVQTNVEFLRESKVHFVGPEAGWLSCRQKGTGRMSEPEAILKRTQELLRSSD